MAKRAKKENGSVPTVTIPAVEIECHEVRDMPGGGLEFTPLPSIEARLAALETQLSESQALVNKQAAVIIMGAENAERLRKSRSRGKQLEIRMNESKKQARTDKQAYEAWVEEHFSLEEELSTGQERLPFPPPEQGGVSRPRPEDSDPKDSPISSRPNTDSSGNPAEDESWRSTPLDTLDLPKSITSKLYEANICTMGDLSDYQLPGPTGYVKRLTDIPGVGEASAEKILEAAAAFWGEWGREQAANLEAETLLAVEATEAERDGFSANGEWEESEAGGDEEPDPDDDE